MINLPSCVLSYIHHAQAGLAGFIAAISLLLPYTQT